MVDDGRIGSIEPDGFLGHLLLEVGLDGAAQNRLATDSLDRDPLACQVGGAQPLFVSRKRGTEMGDANRVTMVDVESAEVQFGKGNVGDVNRVTRGGRGLVGERVWTRRIVRGGAL